MPFYVAAPLTSVDLSLSSGQEIVIEERSPKELLNARGGLGEPVAAPGISVWNPAFDVTPASLISGIITEKVLLILTAFSYDFLSKYRSWPSKKIPPFGLIIGFILLILYKLILFKQSKYKIWFNRMT